jgi:HSP20 family protein
MGRRAVSSAPLPSFLWDQNIGEYENIWQRIGQGNQVPPFLDNFVDRLLPRRKNDNEEQYPLRRTIPSTNISDDDVAFELSVALLGLEKEEVDIEVVDDYLTITAQLEQNNEERGRNWVRQEFVHNSLLQGVRTIA